MANIAEVTQESKKVEDLRKANKAVRSKAARSGELLEKQAQEIEKLKAQLKAFVEANGKVLPKNKKAKKSKKAVEAYYNLFDGKMNKFKNGIVSVRKSLIVNMKTEEPARLDAAIKELNKNQTLVVGKRTYYTTKGFNEINK